MNSISRLYLNTCYLCSTDGLILCEDCFRKYISLDTPRRCHVCNKETYHELMHKECREYSYLDGLIYLTDYSDLAKELIFLGKYSGCFTIYKEFGYRVVETRVKDIFLNRTNEPINLRTQLHSLVTSVPLHRTRFLERGFNQAEIFGREVARNMGSTYLSVLERTRKSKKQHGLDKNSRAQNIANLFKVKGNLDLNQFSQIYICDDIYTTGKTLNECAKALKETYSGKVYGIVIAKV
jgi:competence protein ComFC